MGEKTVVRTKLENPPKELVYAWGDPYQRFKVEDDGVVEGLTPDHPRWIVLRYEWKLEVEKVNVKSKPQSKEEVNNG